MEWISVSDGLPEWGTPVLVFTDDFEFASIQEDGQWYLWGQEFEMDGFLPEGAVNHWAHLVSPCGE